MKTLHYILVSILVFPWGLPLYSSTRSGSHLSYHTNKTMRPTDPAQTLAQLLSINTLVQNYDRVIQEYPEEASSSTDTLKWSRAKTDKEIISTLKSLLEKRLELHKLSAQPLMYELQVRRAHRVLRSRSEDSQASQYDLLVSAVMNVTDLTSRTSHRHSTTSDTKAFEDLILQEIEGGTKAKLYPQALRLAEYLSLREHDEKARTKRLQNLRPLFEGSEESVVIDFLITKAQEEDKVSALRDKVLDDDASEPQEREDKAWFTARGRLLSVYESYLSKLSDKTYKKRIQAAKASLTQEIGALHIQHYEAKSAKVTLRMTAVSPKELTLSGEKEAYDTKGYSRSSQVFAQTLQPSPYDIIRKEVVVTLPSVGQYIFRLQRSHAKGELSTQYLTHARLHMSSREGIKEVEVFATDPADGHPISDVVGRLFDHQGKSLIETYTSDKKGRMSIPKREKDYRLVVSDPRLAYGEHTSYIHRRYKEEKVSDTSTEVYYYTDRPVYRYGQSIHVGIVCVEQKGQTLRVLPHFSDNVHVYAEKDGKDIRLATIPITTNDNGVAEISYTLPSDERYTDFALTLGNDHYTHRHTLEVQAYKLQHLKVHIDSIPSGYVVGRPLVIHGRVTDINGHPTSARVSLSYDTPPSRRTLSAEVDHTGKFVLQTPPISEYRSFYREGIEVSAIDPMGQIATTHHYISKEETDLPLNAGGLSDEFTFDKSSFTLNTKTQPYLNRLLGDLDRYSITAYLKDEQGKETPLGTLPINGTQTFKRPSLKSGKYTLGIRATDGYGKETSSETSDVILYSPKDTHTPITTPLWVQPYTPETKSKKSNASITLRVGSTYDNYVSILVYNAGEVVHHDIVRMSRGIADIQIPSKVLQERSGTIHLSTEYNAERYHKSIDIDGELLRQSPTVTLTPLLEAPASYTPRSEVVRRYKVTSEGKPLAHAAVLVTVFDKAIHDVVGRGGTAFWSKIHLPEEDDFIPFEGGFDGGFGAPIMMEANSMSKQTLRSVSMDAAPSPESESTLRSDFSETAYFTALLTTDAQGEVEYRYTLPDTQTKYIEKVFVFDQDLKTQLIDDKDIDVFAPVSIELHLPRYLTQGDEMREEALLRNTLESSISVTYSISIGDKALADGAQTLSPQSTVSIPFVVRPHDLTSDSLRLLAQLRSPSYTDAILRTIPIRSDREEYPVAVPFSLYKTTETQLTLPKGDQSDRSYHLFGYFDPLPLILTRLAQEYRLSMAKKIDQQSIYESLHQYVVYSQLSALLTAQPQLVDRLRESLSTLRRLAPNGSVDLAHDRGYFIHRRMTDPQTLIYFYDFITDRDRLESYLDLLAQKIRGEMTSEGGWSFAASRPSPWLTLYVLELLGDAPRSARLSTEIQKAIDYLDVTIQREQTGISLIDYSLIRYTHGLGLQGMDKGLRTRLDTEAREAYQHYRDFWVSRLMRYGRFSHYHNRKSEDKIVQKFIDDMGKYTHSDAEEVAFGLYRYEREQGQPSDALIALLLRHKQGNLWHDISTIRAVALLLSLLSPSHVPQGASLSINGQETTLTDLERALGQVSRSIEGSLSTLHLALGKGVKTDNFFGGICYTVTEPKAQITPTGTQLKVEKEVWARRSTPEGKSSLVRVSQASPAYKGEALIVRYTLSTDRDLSLITLQDDRAAASEPGYTLDGHKVSDRVWWAFRRTESTDLIYIDYLPRGRHVLELEATATAEGVFVYGPAIAVSYYAPEFVGNSSGGQVSVSAYPTPAKK